jgi:hypothetical protein
MLMANDRLLWRICWGFMLIKTLLLRHHQRLSIAGADQRDGSVAAAVLARRRNRQSVKTGKGPPHTSTEGGQV